MSEHPHGSFLNYKQRILYSLFRCVCRISLRLSMPLAQITELFQMAYFHEARQVKGLGLSQVASLFGKSLRTVSNLHHRYRGDFFAPEQEVQLRRELALKIEQSPINHQELADAFPDIKDVELVTAVDDLLREKRVLQDGERYRRNPEDHDFFSETDISARVDGLNRQMDIVAEAVWKRFFEESSPGTATARSYVFQGTPEDFGAMQEALTTFLRDQAIAVDDAAQTASTSTRCAITLAATPLEETL